MHDFGYSFKEETVSMSDFKLSFKSQTFLSRHLKNERWCFQFVGVYQTYDFEYSFKEETVSMSDR